MNQLTIIGNLTKDPELRATQSGISVCSFTVAVNRKKTAEGQPDADFFNVTAWRELGVNCHNYLQKGKKVCVVGPVSLKTYSKNDGGQGANMEVVAQTVEFLSPKSEASEPVQKPEVPKGFSKVEQDDDFPF